MCLRAYAIIFLTCPKFSPNSSTCITKVLFVLGVPQLGLEGNVGENLHELSPIQQEMMIYKEPLIFFDANPRGKYCKILLKILCSKASVQSLEFVAIMRFQWRKKSRPKRWKRPTTPTNQHQPPNHHLLGLKQQLTTSIKSGLATHLCDQLLTAVNCCHRRNYLGLGKSDGCINLRLEIR